MNILLARLLKGTIWLSHVLWQLWWWHVQILSMRLASVDHSDSLFSQSHANLPQQPPTHGFQPAGVFGANCSALDFRQSSLNGNLERGLSRDDSVSTVTTQLFQESCISSHVDAAAAVTAIEAHDHVIQVPATNPFE
jgi:hypothetical protein